MVVGDFSLAQDFLGKVKNKGKKQQAKAIGYNALGVLYFMYKQSCSSYISYNEFLDLPTPMIIEQIEMFREMKKQEQEYMDSKTKH